MTAADALLDLAGRLTEADARLRALAYAERWSPLDNARLSGKAEMARAVLDWVRELQRMAGADL